MSLGQSLYFLGLSGGLAGLACWIVVSLITTFVQFPESPWLAFCAVPLLACLASMAGHGFGDHYGGREFSGRWIALGALFGLLAGAVGGALILLLESSNLMNAAPILVRLLAWSLAGCFTGLALGLRWVSSNPRRFANYLFAGLAGGLAGGLVMVMLDRFTPDLSLALAYILTAAGVVCGSASKPEAPRAAFLVFISSGDAVVQSKFKGGKEWVLPSGGMINLGNRENPKPEIHIPDASMAPLHAQVYFRSGVYYLVRHSDIRAHHLASRHPLLLRRVNVSDPLPLRHGDEIVIGKNSLIFELRAIR